jgi:uncharacterized heparinase superfamily protein
VLLKDYKKKTKKTTQDIAWEFNTTAQKVHYWLSAGGEVTGKKPRREIKLVRIVAQESEK